MKETDTCGATGRQSHKGIRTPRPPVSDETIRMISVCMCMCAMRWYVSDAYQCDQNYGCMFALINWKNASNKATVKANVINRYCLSLRNAINCVYMCVRMYVCMYVGICVFNICLRVHWSLMPLSQGRHPDPTSS